MANNGPDRRSKGYTLKDALLRPRSPAIPHGLPRRWRWLQQGEWIRVDDVACDPRIAPVRVVLGGGRFIEGMHPIRRQVEAHPIETETGLSLVTADHRRTTKKPTTYKTFMERGHPLANKAGIVPFHRAVLYEKIGPGTHSCHWCSRPVTWSTCGAKSGVLISDHVDFDVNNNSPENLVPACLGCNSMRKRGCRTKPGEPVLVFKGSVARAEERMCEWCRKKFLARLVMIRKGGGRFCSHRCVASSRGHHDRRGLTVRTVEALLSA